MKVKVLALVAATLTVTLLSAFPSAPEASASPRINIGVRVNAPPPPLRREVVVVRPGPSYVWVPGYWDWAPARHDYVWVGGVWLRPPYRHAAWIGPRWVRRGHYRYFVRGHWRRRW